MRLVNENCSLYSSAARDTEAIILWAGWPSHETATVLRMIIYTNTSSDLHNLHEEAPIVTLTSGITTKRMVPGLTVYQPTFRLPFMSWFVFCITSSFMWFALTRFNAWFHKQTLHDWSEYRTWHRSTCATGVLFQGRLLCARATAVFI